MDMLTFIPHNISLFVENGCHKMDFCGIEEASKKMFGIYLKRGKIFFLKNNVMYLIFIISKIGIYMADFTASRT